MVYYKYFIKRVGRMTEMKQENLENLLFELSQAESLEGHSEQENEGISVADGGFLTLICC